jgi:hypothetical protein
MKEKINAITLKNLFFGIFAVCLLTLVLSNPVSAQGGAVIPILDCVEFDESTNQLTAFWGYYNPTGSVRNLLVGSQNNFFPAPINRGQPTSFMPGRVERAFSTVSPADTRLFWILDGNSDGTRNDPAIYCGPTSALNSAFTFQGRLTDAGTSPNGQYDFQFRLFTAETGGTPLGTTAVNGVSVVNGIFTVQLDFGAMFFTNRQARFLEISVRQAGGDFTTLAPRQLFTRTPYAFSAETANRLMSDNLFNTLVGTGAGAGSLPLTGSGNVVLGAAAGTIIGSGSNNTFIGTGARSTISGLRNSTAIGAGATVGGNNQIVLGTGNETVIIPGQLSLAGSLTMALNDGLLRLRVFNDENHGIVYNSAIDGPEFRAFGGFIWRNGSNGATERMRLTANGSLFITGTLTQSSDVRFKENVQNIRNPLDSILNLRGVTYNWKSELNQDTRPQIGFIAQEVEQVLPELVSTDKDGYKSVSYTNAVPVLVEAIKEQQKQIEAQAGQLEIEQMKQFICSQSPSAAFCKREEK